MPFEIMTPFWRSDQPSATVMVEHMEQQAGADGDSAEFGLEADQAARRNQVFGRTRPLPSGSMFLSCPLREPGAHDAALELFFHVDDQLFPAHA
jgi:hypothetical protein